MMSTNMLHTRFTQRERFDNAQGKAAGRCDGEEGFWVGGILKPWLFGVTSHCSVGPHSMDALPKQNY